MPNDKNDHLMLPPEVEEAGPYEVPLPREVMSLDTYCPACKSGALFLVILDRRLVGTNGDVSFGGCFLGLNVPHIRRLTSVVT